MGGGQPEAFLHTKYSFWPSDIVSFCFLSLLCWRSLFFCSVS